MYFLGIDIGSSSIKVCLLNGNTNSIVGSAQSPETELDIIAHETGWAEQHPETWWHHLTLALGKLKQNFSQEFAGIKALGISYQMHGLVLTDAALNVLRPSIIWCDSRAVGIGDKAFSDLGEDWCLSNLLNSPGNFTASKLKWVKENEPWLYEKAANFMLPGDYIAARLTGEILTTPSGLSEGIMWNFKEEKPASRLLDYYGIDPYLCPEIKPSFGLQGIVKPEIATALGLPDGIQVTYRAGDQPNNAFSLGVLEPGEVAANAGTSGVIYGIQAHANYDPVSRVNTFVHVNHTTSKPRYGVLACVNGTGIANSWTRKLLSAFTNEAVSYKAINEMAALAPEGAHDLQFFPYGNGAERTLGNANPGGKLQGLNFNIHQPAHVVRAVQEGIVFALKHGLQVMESMGMSIHTVKAGNANMFLSPVFRQVFANVTQAQVALYEADGAAGAALAAGIGFGHFSMSDASKKAIETIEPNIQSAKNYQQIYNLWLEKLLKEA